MADIKITDNFGLSADLQIRDDSPLAKAKLTHLVSAGKELFDEFGKPVDQADLKIVSFGATATSPDLLSSDLPNLTIGGGVNCGISVLSSTDGFVFGKDPFALPIPIASNEAWLGVELDLIAKVKAALSASFVGVSFEGDAKLSCTTYTLSSVPKPPLPLLRDACATAFSNFSITTSSESIRKQLPGTVNQSEVSGSITGKITLKQPYTLNPLASADLPFNTSASLQPNVTLQVAGSVTITGDFIFRSYKKSLDVIQIGVYKKRGSTFTAAFTAGAGIGGNIGDDNILAALLNAALPGVDVTKAGITGDNAKALNKVIKDGIDRSLSAQLNATCSAAHTDEAAVAYEIQLTSGAAAATDNALKLAMQGDWTSLEELPNAHRIRNIIVDTIEKKLSLTLNLFGFYSFTSVTDYVKSCTLLLDASGQASLIDKLDASRISATVTPYTSDSEKLRKALMEDFLCTATYAAASGKLNLQLSATQSYLDYQRNMSRSEMKQNILLGYELDLIPQGSLNGILGSNPVFQHACTTATVRYDNAALLAIFFSDPTAQKARMQDEIEKVGRETMCAFLDPSDPTDAVRMEILNNSDAWKAMNEIGNTHAFGDIVYLQHLGTTQLAAVAGDWVSIRWYADAISEVAPALLATMAALATTGTNPTQDPQFMKQRAKLANVLGAVTRNTDAAFVHGWGEAVMFVLSGKRGLADINLAWNSNQLHFGPQ